MFLHCFIAYDFNHIKKNLFKIHGLWNPSPEFHGFRRTHSNAATAICPLGLKSQKSI